MFKVKKRRKSSRYRGGGTAKRGAKERTRGSGNRGGKGMAGTGKRGDQRKTYVIKLTGGNNYFGKSKTLRRGTAPVQLKAINLSDIVEKGNHLGTLDYSGYKILGEGDVMVKLTIKASAASASAIKKVTASGGQIILPEVKVRKAEVKPAAKPEQKAK